MRSSVEHEVLPKVRQRHDRTVRETAQTYAERGYEVVAHPEEVLLPEVVRPFHELIDVLAEQDGERVAVAVQVGRRFMPPDLSRLAEVARAEPGWRFDLVLVRELEEQHGRQPLPRADVRARAEEARALHHAGHEAAALLLAWTLVQALLRHLAARADDIELTPNARGYVQRSLFTLGYLDRATQETLDALTKRIDPLYHGMAPGADAPEAETPPPFEAVAAAADALHARLDGPDAPPLFASVTDDD
jgi:hypothetical protein